LILGVGVGSIEQETRALGSIFKERGAISDEAIAVMRALWTQEDPKFDGKYSHFSGMKFSPKPMQKPSIPLVIGGVSRAAIRRAARLGDGWQPLGLAPDALGAEIALLHEEAMVYGRKISQIPVSITLGLEAPETRRRYALGRDPAGILKNAQAYAKLGVDTLVISANTSDAREAHSTLEMIAREVLAAFVS
jgi:alkanesulfonate monooxygenase SsuD/methylene tetrahydromethanopterin reductase-like flavin-dependent oxidoreductase (luciferase family)